MDTKRDTVIRQLSEARKYLAAIVAASPAAIISLDADGRVTTWNQAAERMFGWSIDEIRGQPLPFIPAEGQDEFLDLRRRALDGEILANVELRRYRKDGSEFWISLSTAAVRDDHGRITEVMAVCTDISQRRQMADQLRRERDRAQHYLDVAGVLMLALDENGRIELVNRQGEQLLGWRQEELVGREWLTTCVPEADRDRVGIVFANLMRGEISRFEHITGRVVTRSGDIRSIDWHNALLRDERGAIIGTLSSGRDVTAQRAAEEQLRVAQRMEAIGRLAGGIAHDFNNLLTVISSYSELALGRLPDSHPVRADIAPILEAGKRAARLTGQLLAFSRRQVLQPEVIDLNQVLVELEKMLRRLLGEDIELVLMPADGLSSVKVDPGQVEQVVMNLAVNARDAMPRGGKLIIATSAAELDEVYAAQHPAVRPGDYVLLTVSDTGCGMDSETIDRVFEPFFTTKQRGKGTGLGLSTVYGIVKQSGGNVWVYSEPGQGTTVKVYLPAVDAPAGPRKRPRPVAGARGDEAVLVVEDEPAVRELAARTLAEAGFEVLVAADGEQALGLAERRQVPVRLLLTDVVMPRMSGRELAGRLRDRWPELRVLYMSGYTDEAIVHHGVLDPGTQLLSKPFTCAELTSRVREVLDGSDSDLATEN